MSDLRAPIARARGLGSAKDGTHHFILQRLTAIALVPLSLWLGVCVASLASAEHQDVIAWISTPWVTVLLLSFIIAAAWHAALGIQIVLEDYIHAHQKKIAALVFSKLAIFLLGITAVVAVLRIAVNA